MQAVMTRNAAERSGVVHLSEFPGFTRCGMVIFATTRTEPTCRNCLQTVDGYVRPSSWTETLLRRVDSMFVGLRHDVGTNECPACSYPWHTEAALSRHICAEHPRLWHGVRNHLRVALEEDAG